MEGFLTSSIRRYYEFEVPPPRRDGARWPLLIALHGYEGNKDSMMAVARRVAGADMAVISLQAPNQFFIPQAADGRVQPGNRRVGFGWGTTFRMEESIALHHQNIRALISLASKRFHADRKRVFLMAFSQACSYNYRFVFTYPKAVLGAISVCGGLPNDWDSNPRFHAARTHVLHIAATQDEWYSTEKNLEIRRMLAGRAASLDFRFYRTSHKFPRPAIHHIRNWIGKTLEQHERPEC